LKRRRDDRTFVHKGKRYNLDEVGPRMEPDIRARIHQEAAPCDPQEFWDRYTERVSPGWIASALGQRVVLTIADRAYLTLLAKAHVAAPDASTCEYSSDEEDAIVKVFEAACYRLGFSDVRESDRIYAAIIKDIEKGKVK
jgi:hypothetical protein